MKDELFPKKLSLSSQKYRFRIRDPRSGIRDPEKTYSGSRIRGQKGTGSRSATLVSTFLILSLLFLFCLYYLCLIRYWMHSILGALFIPFRSWLLLTIGICVYIYLFSANSLGFFTRFFLYTVLRYYEHRVNIGKRRTGNIWLSSWDYAS